MGLNFRSPTIPYAAGRSIIPTDFIKRRGPRDGRAVIRRLDFVISARFTTGAGVTLSKRDLVSICRQLEIYDSGGIRRNMDGFHAKIWGQDDMAERYPGDDSDVAANTANQDRTIVIPVYFQRPTDFAPDDFGLPGDDILGGQIAFTWATDAQLSGNGGTVAIVSANTSLQVVAWYEEEGDTQFKSRDEINFVEMESASTFRLPVDGGLLDGAFIHKQDTTGANPGGVAVSTITDVTIEHLGQIAVPRAALQAAYKMDRGGDYTDGNMVDLGVAMPLFWQQHGTKMRHRVQFPANLLGRLTSTMATGRVTYRVVRAKSLTQMQAAAIANGLPADAPVRVKTRGKTMRSRAAWKGGDKFLPTKVGAA